MDAEQVLMPREGEQDEPDELAFAFPEHHHQLPQRQDASWGIFNKARQV